MNSAKTSRPYPLKSQGRLWLPCYRIVLSSNVEGIAPLLVTETDLVLVSKENDAYVHSQNILEVDKRLLEVGSTRSDLPKALDTSWTRPWVSFPRRNFTPSGDLSAQAKEGSAKWWNDWFEGVKKASPGPNAGVTVTVLGSFVKPNFHEYNWVEVNRGAIQSTFYGRDGWISLLVGQESPTRPTEPKEMKLSFVMLATLFVWGFKYYEFLGQHSTASSSFGLFNVLHEATPADWGGHLAVLLLVVVHHLRMSLGVEFAGRDTSFFRAKLHAPEKRRQRLAWVESLLLALIVSGSVLLTYVVGHVDYLWVALVLAAQGAVVMLYDVAFWNALLKYDEEKAANKFVVAGDFLFLFTAMTLLVSRFWDLAYGHPMGMGVNTKTIFLGLCFVYSGIFLVEVLWAYPSALRGAAVEAWTAIKNLFGYAYDIWKERGKKSEQSQARP